MSLCSQSENSSPSSEPTARSQVRQEWLRGIQIKLDSKESADVLAGRRRRRLNSYLEPAMTLSAKQELDGVRMDAERTRWCRREDTHLTLLWLLWSNVSLRQPGLHHWIHDLMENVSINGQIQGQMSLMCFLLWHIHNKTMFGNCKFYLKNYFITCFAQQQIIVLWNQAGSWYAHSIRQPEGPRKHQMWTELRHQARLPQPPPVLTSKSWSDR